MPVRGHFQLDCLYPYCRHPWHCTCLVLFPVVSKGPRNLFFFPAWTFFLSDYRWQYLKSFVNLWPLVSISDVRDFTMVCCLKFLHRIVLVDIQVHLWLPHTGDDSQCMWAWLPSDLHSLQLHACSCRWTTCLLTSSSLYISVISVSSGCPLVTFSCFKPLEAAFNWCIKAGKMRGLNASEILLLLANIVSVFSLIASAKQCTVRSLYSLIRAFQDSAKLLLM